MNFYLRTRAAIGVLGFLVASASSASISIGSGGSISMGGGSLGLGGTDLMIDGQFRLESGSVSDAGSVVINGTFNGGSGLFELSEDWLNAGTFNAATGTVMFSNGGGDSAIVGDSTFYGLAMLGLTGGAFVLETGSFQRVTDRLTIQGGSGSPVQIESSNPPQVAQLFLDPGGTQDIAFVGVSNVHATGQALAPDQTNQGGSGNDRGWFGVPLDALPIPALSVPGLAILILALFGVAFTRRSSAA